MNASQAERIVNERAHTAVLASIQKLCKMFEDHGEKKQFVRDDGSVVDYTDLSMKDVPDVTKEDFTDGLKNAIENFNSGVQAVHILRERDSFVEIRCNKL